MQRIKFIFGAILAAITILVPTEFASSRETNEPADKDFAKRTGEYDEFDYPSYLLQAYYEAHPEAWDSSAYNAGDTNTLGLV